MYEYMSKVVYAQDDETLNELGKAGWEAYSTMDWGDGKIRVFLKRRYGGTESSRLTVTEITETVRYPKKG